MKKTSTASVGDATTNTDTAYANTSSPALTFDQLSQTEQACASLGVGPEQFRPLGWLNSGHFEALVKNNQMDDTLVRRLEAYKVVAERG